MSNPNENRINTTISAADLATINTAAASINTVLDGFAQNLTQDERDSMFGLGADNEEFADNALEQGQTLNAQMPPAMQLIITNMANDATLFDQLKKIEDTLINPLVQRIADTRRLASHEQYSAALAIYKFIEAGATLGLPGFQAAYDVLKVRFARQGGNAPQQTP